MATKAEARVARQNAKLIKAKEKSARLVASTQSAISTGSKSPRASENPDSIYDMMVEWDRGTSDCSGDWSWNVCRNDLNTDWDGAIYPKLIEWEKIKWKEVSSQTSDSGHTMHHDTDTERICEETQHRLLEIDQFRDVIFRFRIGNKKRLWGFRVVNKFEIIWYDPTHKIYPVSKV